MSRMLTLAGMLLAVVATDAARAEVAREDVAIAPLQVKVPPPRPESSCYYRRQCANSPRYGQLCWRVGCPPLNNDGIRR